MTDAEKVALVRTLVQRDCATAELNRATKAVLKMLLGRAPTPEELREATLG